MYIINITTKQNVSRETINRKELLVSHRTMITLNDKMYDSIKAEAEEQHRSVNKQITIMLIERNYYRKKYSKIIKYDGVPTIQEKIEIGG